MAHAHTRNNHIAGMQRTVLDKQCCNRAAPLVKARFYDGSLRQTIRICFQIRNLCDKIDVLKQIVDSLAGSAETGSKWYRRPTVPEQGRIRSAPA